MTVDEVLSYVTNSPENTNYAVLKSMLNELAEGSGGGGVSGMVVEILFDENDIPYINCPSNELYEAVSSGTHVVVVSENDDGSGALSILGATMTLLTNENAYRFIVTSHAIEDTLSVMQFVGYNDEVAYMAGAQPEPDPDHPTT